MFVLCFLELPLACSGCKVLNSERGTTCQQNLKVCEKGSFSVENCIEKCKGLDFGVEPSRIRLC